MKINKATYLLIGLLSTFNTQADMITAYQAAQDKDYTLAAQHFQQSADLGLVKAQSALSKLYLHGAGVNKDPILSFVYMALAYEQDQSDELQQQMSVIYQSLSESDQQAALAKYDEYALKQGKSALAENILPILKSKPFTLKPGKRETDGLSVSAPIYSAVKSQISSIILEYDVGPDGRVRNIGLAHDFFVMNSMKKDMLRNTYSLKYQPKTEKVYLKNNIEQLPMTWAQDINKERLKDKSPKFYNKIIALEKYAEQNNANALYELGMYYIAFPALNTSRIKSLVYMEKATKLGHPKAPTEYAYALFNGKGIKRDFQAGFNYLLTAAQSADPRSQYRLGRELLSGQIIKKDVNKAIFWLTQAANGDDENAKYWLAKSLLEQENITTEQVTTAKNLLEQVEDLDNPSWSYYVAQCYLAQHNLIKAREFLADAITLAEEYNWNIENWKNQLAQLNSEV